MGVSAQLVFQGHDRLRYLLTSDSESGGTVTISNAQLQIDALAGPLRRIARAKDDGIGTVAAGTPLTQDQARDILCADNSGASVGNKNAPRAKMITTPRTGSTDVWVDANVDGAGKPVIAASIATSSSSALLDIIDLGANGTT
jgi:hypothetical protein